MRRFRFRSSSVRKKLGSWGCLKLRVARYQVLGTSAVTMSGGSPELVEVQEKLQTLTAEYDRLNDEWTSKLADQQADFQKEKHVRPKDLFCC